MSKDLKQEPWRGNLKFDQQLKTLQNKQPLPKSSAPLLRLFSSSFLHIFLTLTLLGCNQGRPHMWPLQQLTTIRLTKNCKSSMGVFYQKLVRLPNRRQTFSTGTYNSLRNEQHGFQCIHWYDAHKRKSAETLDDVAHEMCKHIPVLL